ncbi:MAG: hypothetical protein V4681_03960 [Patescibacteria group bacterium]
MNTREQVVVVGFGWVGQANAIALDIMGYPVAFYDPGSPTRHYDTYAAAYERMERLESLLAKDSLTTCYLVCVGDRVSEEGVQDISLITAALDSLKGVQGTVVLRSTVLPDSLESLAFDYYVPEFLHEKKAVEECLAPFYVVVGTGGTMKKEPSFLNLWRAKTPRIFTGTPREAAFVKYLSNLWNAVRIAFVNEFGDVIGTPHSKEELDSVERIINFVMRGESYLRYGRAFGGHCLPKDMRAFMQFYANDGKSVDMLRGTYAANDKHEELQKRHAVLPEWYSSWPLPHLSGFVALRELAFSLRKNLRNPGPLLARYLGGRKGRD